MDDSISFRSYLIKIYLLAILVTVLFVMVVDDEKKQIEIFVYCGADLFLTGLTGYVLFLRDVKKSKERIDKLFETAKVYGFSHDDPKKTYYVNSDTVWPVVTVAVPFFLIIIFFLLAASLDWKVMEHISLKELCRNFGYKGGVILLTQMIAFALLWFFSEAFKKYHHSHLIKKMTS